jgi:hypothetical protein
MRPVLRRKQLEEALHNQWKENSALIKSSKQQDEALHDKGEENRALCGGNEMYLTEISAKKKPPSRFKCHASNQLGSCSICRTPGVVDANLKQLPNYFCHVVDRVPCVVSRRFTAT